MQRFDEQFILKEVSRRMRANEAHAAMARELKRAKPSLRQRLAWSLVGLAERLEPGLYREPANAEGPSPNVVVIP
jgi:hypothetical protein